MMSKVLQANVCSNKSSHLYKEILESYKMIFLYDQIDETKKIIYLYEGLIKMCKNLKKD